MMEGQLFQELKKRDDDVSVELVDGSAGVYRVTTVLPLGEMNMEGMAVQTSPPEEPTTTENLFAMPPENVSILMVKYLFMALALYAFCAMLFSLPLYMWHVPEGALIALQVLGAVGVLLSYSVMCILHGHVAQKLELSIIPLFTWFTSLTLLLAAAAGLSHSLVPYQLLALWWVQCVAVVIYLQWMGSTTHHVSRLHAILCMALATLIIWALSIATFVNDSDWIASLGLLCIGFASLIYASYQMQGAIEERRYAKTRVDLLSALINYYTDVPVSLCCAY